MTRRLIIALGGLSLLMFAAVWGVVHYSMIYIGGRGFDMIEMVEKPVTVPVGDAERIHMTLQMLYGDLQLEPGSEALLAGSTRYNVAEFAPHILYDEDGKFGRLLVDHLEGADMTRFINRSGRVNEWRFAINKQARIDELEAVVGLGSGHVDLRGLNLRHSTLALLAGDYTVDLRGAWPQTTTVEIDGVTGAITVLLPSETGALVMLDGTPPTLHVTGLTELVTPPTIRATPRAPVDESEAIDEDEQDDKYYVNAAYEENSTTLYILASHAFGTLTLIAE